MKTAVIYIRVSTEEQKKNGYSQRQQEERLVKYCEIHSIHIRKIIFEDHSAKTFKRPEWSKLLTDLKKNKGQTDLILFVKWDRFSRNAPDAYQMLSTLRKLSVEAQAVEQPLDLSIPENKIMLAFYLAAPEAENDRRALNVFYGMRRAKKEGRYMGTAPLGYINRIDEVLKRKYIAPMEEEAKILKWAFHELAKGVLNTEQVWKKAKQMGLRRGSKNNFWVAIRNPLYCGKIFIPKHKDEDGCLVQGQHQPIISEALFYEVQDVLEGRKKIMRTKIAVDENFPLRGFLICPKCGKTLTASASKGCKGVYYRYYHCSSVCGIRYSCDKVNQGIVGEIKKYATPLPKLQLYKEVISSVFKSKNQTQVKEINECKAQLENARRKLAKGMDLLLDEAIDAEDYRSMKKQLQENINRLEVKIMSLASETRNIEPLWDKAITNISQLDLLYTQGNTIEKRKIVSSIFPEKLIFDGFQYRTSRVNDAVNVMCLIDRKLQRKKNGTSADISDLSQEVIPLGFEPSRNISV